MWREWCAKLLRIYPVCSKLDAFIYLKHKYFTQLHANPLFPCLTNNLYGPILLGPTFAGGTHFTAIRNGTSEASRVLHFQPDATKKSGMALLVNEQPSDESVERWNRVGKGRMGQKGSRMRHLKSERGGIWYEQFLWGDVVPSLSPWSCAS